MLSIGNRGCRGWGNAIIAGGANNRSGRDRQQVLHTCSMFKAVKDFKRRSIQTVVKTSGLKTEEIIDEDYEESVKKFRVMVNEMQTTSDTLHRFLTSQKTCYAEGKELSSSLSTVYEINGSDEWPGVISDLQFEAQSASMKEKWTEVNVSMEKS